MSLSWESANSGLQEGGVIEELMQLDMGIGQTHACGVVVEVIAVIPERFSFEGVIV